MKKISVLILSLLLTGCLSTPHAPPPAPPKRTFPSVPDDLLVACADLKVVDIKTEKLSELIKTVSENYGMYHDCKDRLDHWIKWYQQQKSIFNDVK